METQKESIGVGLKIIIGICGVMLVMLGYFATHPRTEAPDTFTTPLQDREILEEIKADKQKEAELRQEVKRKFIISTCAKHELELLAMVKRRLNYPLTAEFGPSKFVVAEPDSMGAFYMGSVVSKNAFGVPSELTYIFILKLDGDKVRLLNFTLE